MKKIGMKQEMVRQELIRELQTTANYSDQRLANRLRVARETVRKARKQYTYDVLTYLGKNFVNWRIQEMMAAISRYKRMIDQLEELKTKTEQRIVHFRTLDQTNKRHVTVYDIKYLQPRHDTIVRITKKQLQIEDKIQKILTSDILKVINLPDGGTDSPFGA